MNNIFYSIIILTVCSSTKKENQELETSSESS